MPDAATLASAARYGGRIWQLFLRKRAREEWPIHRTNLSPVVILYSPAFENEQRG